MKALVTVLVLGVLAFLGFHFGAGMSLQANLLVTGLIVIFLLGAPLFSIMLGATALGAIFLPRSFDAEFGGALVSTYGNGTKDEATVFAAIPLFIYAGYLMSAGKTADRLVRFANALFGWVPGGLAIVTIFACAVFTVFTGASGVTIIALGGVVMPALIKQRYPERFSLGLVAGTGSVGLLFPPALPLFIYGTVYSVHSQSVTSLRTGETLKKIYDFETVQFLASGIGPGLVLLGCLSVVAIIAAIAWKVPRTKFSITELGRSFVWAIPELAMPILLIALLATGKANVPQLAGLTVLYLIVLEMGVFRDYGPKTLWRIGTESLALIGTIFLVIYTSQALTNLLITAEVPQKIVKWTTAHVHEKWVFLLALNVILLLVGTMMDIFSAVIIVLPLVMAVADFYQVNPYHLGVIFLLNLEIGYIHPPVGINLFIAAFKFQKRLGEVVIAVLPFLGAMIVALILVTYIPQFTYVPPPKRESPLSALSTVVHDGYLNATAIGEIALPDGTVLKKEECDKKAYEADKEACFGMFVDVSDCRRAKDAACEQKAITEYLETTGAVAATADAVTLPGGVVLKPADCERVRDELDRETCTELFGDIATCRTEESPVLAKECEEEKLTEYVDDMGDQGLGEDPLPPKAGTETGTGTGTGSEEEEDEDEEEDEEEADAGAGSGTGTGTGTGTGSGTGTGTGTGSQ